MPTLFDDLAAVSDALASTSGRNDKVGVISDLLARLGAEEIVPAVAFLIGTTPVGRVGVGWSALSGVRVDPASVPTLDVSGVDRFVRALAEMSGAGVVAARHDRLLETFGRATEREQRLLVGVLGGELRHGALDGVMVSAVAKAASVPVGSVRRAAMMMGDLTAAAHLALTQGRSALDAASMQPLTPVQPMLASPASDVAEALGGADGASVEWKLDGARLQAHRRGGEVRLFTRNLNDVTDRLTEVADVVRGFGGGDLVLDGEVLGVDDDGVPERFQDTMGTIQRDRGQPRRGGTAGGKVSGLRAYFFDAMYAGGSPIHDEPLAVRRELLHEVVPSTSRLPSIVTADPREAQAFLDGALGAGHEGVMVKSLADPYAAGRRGASWRKVKPVHTLDLVVLAVEWGHGRRQGWLSNLHLGAAASGTDGEFVMVGKTFKGLTDDLLRWQTERFLALEIGRGQGSDGHVVYVRPEQVVEVAVDGVQVSTRYPGGVALRFARVRSYRQDKPAADADTIDAVRALL